MKKIFKILGIIFLIVFTFAAIALISVNVKSNSNEYKIGEDSISSVKAIVGKRSISGISVDKDISKGVYKNTYVYKNVENVKEDLATYITSLLQNEKFTVLTDYDLNNASGKLDLGKESSQENIVVVMSITWDINSFTIDLLSSPGTLTYF